MKKLLLHTCCAPCLSGTFDQLTNEYDPVIYWYNPNIEPIEEHTKRLEALLDYLNKKSPEAEIIFKYDYALENKKWHQAISGLENEPEGGERCKKCFAFRLQRAAEVAKAQDLQFTTTLTISPYKNTAEINQIGKEISKEDKGEFLAKDFKKNDGYKKSIENSKEFGIYRQKYCGCKYSLND